MYSEKTSCRAQECRTPRTVKEMKCIVSLSPQFYEAVLIFFVGIRITKDTELGDNNTIKNPPQMESSRSKRRKEKEQSHKFVQRYLSPSFEITLT